MVNDLGKLLEIKMAAESNGGFHSEDMDFAFRSRHHHHAISFQHGALNSMSEMVPMGNYFGLSNSNGIMFSNAGNNNNNNNNSSTINNNYPVISQAGNPSASSSLLLDSVPGLKHDAGLAVEWSADEQYILEESLAKYADEPSIMKYIKIAATLPDKTVRDVALRCRWLARKRRKPDEHSLGKKVNNKKDKPMESKSTTNLHSPMLATMGSYSHMSRLMEQSQHILYDGFCGPMKQLMELNAQVFSQITANLSTYKLQDNIDLFFHTKHNINTILNDMREMPGIMSQMPPLPVAINEDLESILSSRT